MIFDKKKKIPRPVHVFYNLKKNTIDNSIFTYKNSTKVWKMLMLTLNNSCKKYKALHSLFTGMWR